MDFTDAEVLSVIIETLDKMGCNCNPDVGFSRCVHGMLKVAHVDHAPDCKSHRIRAARQGLN